MLDINKLHEVIASYKKELDKYIELELYKWKAIKHFQDNWNIEAEDFAAMFRRATEPAGNLLNSNMSYPGGQIQSFAAEDQEKVRSMFRILYDEEQPVLSRIQQFKEMSKEMFDLHNNTYPQDLWKTMYQSENSISTFLWLRYPDTYYIYKYTEYIKVEELLCHTKTVQRGKGLKPGYEIYNKIREELKKDQELINMMQKHLDDSCYPDKELITTTVDFGFYISHYYESGQTNALIEQSKVQLGNPSSKQYWLYAAGEQANMWQDCLDNGIMSMGWDDLGDFKQYKSSTAIKDKIQEVYGKSNATNDTRSCWDFISGMREGDIVYVKKGMHKIIGQGVVMSDVYYDATREKHKNCRRVKWQHVGEWNIDKTQATLPMKTLTNITKYPDIVTLMEKLIQPQDEPSINYWWLTGSPKYWSPSKKWKLGENIDYTLRNEKGNPRRILKHFYEAKPGDIAITYESTPVLQVVAIGRVVAETDGEVLTIQKIEELSSPIPYAEILENPILKISEPGLNRCQGSLFRLTKEEYDEAMRLIRINNPEPVEKSEIEMPIHTPYTNEDFLSEVYMAEESLNDLKNLLDIKKNVILQGAPGVGKTFSAKRLAYVMMGAKDDSRIKIIQFHQNYSYEDFIMGYKPNATGGFELKDGVFYDFCKKAAQDPDNKYFFIIDEINRGNMSKIFGELLQLIEVDYRNHPIKLAYNNQDFAVPANVYIIGMMNTADRSLAMIDYALRRRFSFFTMAPAFELDSFKQHLNAINDPKLNQLIDKVIELNKAIKNDSSLGEGFVIGHSYFCHDTLDLRTIVRYEILPTLREYWFDNEANIQNWEKELLDAIK